MLSTPSTADNASVVLHITVDAEDVPRMQSMLRERILSEWEFAEDLQALGRPFDETLARAGLCLRLDAALETAKAPTKSGPC